MTTLYSWNVNGIRAAQKKGFLDWLQTVQPDILGVQETKAHPDQLRNEQVYHKRSSSYIQRAQYGFLYSNFLHFQADGTRLQFSCRRPPVRRDSFVEQTDTYARRVTGCVRRRLVGPEDTGHWIKWNRDTFE